MLSHHDDENLFVGLRVVSRGVGAEVRRVQRAADAAFADGTVARGLHDGFRLGAGVHHRHHDAPRAGIEHALDVLDAVDRHSRQRHAAGRCDYGEHLRGGLQAGRRMFELDGEPVEAGLGHELCADDAGQGEPGADAGFTAFEFGANRIGFHVGKELKRET